MLFIGLAYRDDKLLVQFISLLYASLICSKLCIVCSVYLSGMIWLNNFPELKI
jgi:hypothetical protein